MYDLFQKDELLSWMQSVRDQDSLNDFLSVGSPRPHTHIIVHGLNVANKSNILWTCSVSFSAGAEIFVCAQGNYSRSRVDLVERTACCDRPVTIQHMVFIICKQPTQFSCKSLTEMSFSWIFGWGECRMHHLSISTCAYTLRVASREFRLSLVVSHIRWRTAYYYKPWRDNKTQEGHSHGQKEKNNFVRSK